MYTWNILIQIQQGLYGDTRFVKGLFSLCSDLLLFLQKCAMVEIVKKFINVSMKN